MKRTHRLALGVLHEIFYGTRDESGDATGTCHLRHCETTRHKGDIFTKALAKGPFEAARGMMGMRPGECKACWARYVFEAIEKDEFVEGGV